MSNKLIQQALTSQVRNGFTLIELMIVHIVGVLSACLASASKRQDTAKDNTALQAAVNAAKTCSIELINFPDDPSAADVAAVATGEVTNPASLLVDRSFLHWTVECPHCHA